MIGGFSLHALPLEMTFTQYHGVDRTEVAVFLWGATVYLVLKAIILVSSELETYQKN